MMGFSGWWVCPKLGASQTWSHTQTTHAPILAHTPTTTTTSTVCNYQQPFLLSPSSGEFLRDTFSSSSSSSFCRNCCCLLTYETHPMYIKQGVSHLHCGLAIYIEKKKYLKGKRRNPMETQIFHHANLLSSKNPLKETKILQDIITINPNN